MFDARTEKEIAAAAEALGIEPAALIAIAEVESGGQVFADIEGRDEPLIRFEGHYFDKRLSDADRARARADGIASPVAGEVANPASQEARWRLLRRAAAINRQATYESVSWGLGQVMGAHWQWLGFADIDALVAEAREGAAGQARLMARFIDKAGLKQAIERHDWEAFARGYNGPGFRRHGYDQKIAAAYARHSGVAAPAPKPRRAGGGEELLGRGSQGAAVVDLQQMLTALGYPLDDDGQFGSATERAVKDFQREKGLAADGLVGPDTRAAIRKALPLGPTFGEIWSAALGWLKRRFSPR
jgi:hypothetical protein